MILPNGGCVVGIGLPRAGSANVIVLVAVAAAVVVALLCVIVACIVLCRKRRPDDKCKKSITGLM